SPSELEQISQDGKIPRYAHFEKALNSGKISLDALMTQAGLQSFMADQAQLDERIASLIG
ncbi:MAG: transaldolase, partial [Spirochaetae bacterium HGW-Spirochaetae-6]